MFVMNTFLFFGYWNRMFIFLLILFSKRVQILKMEYKYGQYCTPVSQSDCKYFFVITINDNKLFTYFNKLQSRCNSIACIFHTIFFFKPFMVRICTKPENVWQLPTVPLLYICQERPFPFVRFFKGTVMQII